MDIEYGVYLNNPLAESDWSLDCLVAPCSPHPYNKHRVPVNSEQLSDIFPKPGLFLRRNNTLYILRLPHFTTAATLSFNTQ